MSKRGETILKNDALLGMRRKKLKRLLFAIIVALTFSRIGEAQEYEKTYDVGAIITGETLHRLCESDPDTATAYVLGAVDSYLVLRQRAEEDRKLGRPLGNISKMVLIACVPNNVSGTTLKDIVCKELAEQPAKRQYAAASTVWFAITNAYGANCPIE